MTHEATDNALADALWWFRGYSASQPVDAYDRTHDLAGALLTARNWLKRLALGRTRLLGLDDRNCAVVLTEHEFEVLDDATRENATNEEREAGREVIRGVFAAFRAERKEAREPDGGVF